MPRPVRPIVSRSVFAGGASRSNWVCHKTAKIQCISDHTTVRGRILIQSLRRSKVRLFVTDCEVTRLGHQGPSLKTFPELHVYGLTQKKTKFIEEIRNRRAFYLGKIDNVAENQFAFAIPFSMSDAMKFTFVAIVMQHDQYEPEVLIAHGDFSARYESEEVGNRLVSQGDEAVCIATAVAPLDIDNQLQESTVRQYAAAAKSIMYKLGVSESEKIGFEAFKRGLDSADIIILEHRALSLFKSCDEQNFGLISVCDLELCLMVNDACPTTTDRTINLYEIFSSYDVDKIGHLTFIQFQECISTPGLKSRSGVKDLGTLHYIFQKFASGDVIVDYSAFAKLWIRYLVDPGYELKRRNLLEDVKVSRRIVEFVVPFLKGQRRKDRLYKVVKNDIYDGASKFVGVKQRIIQLRKEAQSNSDEVRRSAKRIGRRQKRETLIDVSQRSKNKDNFVLNRRKEVYLRKRRHAIALRKIQEDCEISAKEQRRSIIVEREEKDATEAELIRKTFTDRLVLTNVGLVEIPKYLYEDRNSQMKLMDIKVLDFSQNSLKTLPSTNFFFHLTSIRKLSLSRNNLQRLPEEFDSLKRLEILLLDHNCIEELPHSLGKLEHLQILDISFNKLRILSSEFCSLSKMRILEAHSNCIMDLPHDIGRLEKLESLDMSKNKLVTLPTSICSLGRLFKMNLASNQLSDLPASFGDLASLVELDISCNEIQEVPESISRLCKLRVLSIDNNKLMWIPDCVKGLSSITSFSCQRNEITRLSVQIGNMSLVEHFSCNMNKIEEIPPEIGLLKNLHYLKLQSNSIEVVPVEMGALLRLQRLDLSHNEIKLIPPEFCLMKSLIWLDVSYNSLQNLPENFGTLSDLHTLNASHNKMSYLPSTFQHLRCLEELYLSSNNFNDLDLLLCNHLPIKVLHFEANRIKYLPVEICSALHLEELNLRHNDIRSIPLDLAKHTNSSGQKIHLDLSQNPLTDLPLKFATSENNQTYKNPSGWDLDETFEWMNDENIIYKPAVNEWGVKKDAYMSGYLVFEDFLKGVLWRCENVFNHVSNNVGNATYAELLKSKKYSDRLKRFFFHCKKYGNPPIYEALKAEELSVRRKETIELDRVRKQRAANAKNTDAERRSQEYERYLGGLSERCAKADARMSHVVEHRRHKQRMENDKLLTITESRIDEKHKVDAENEVKRAVESAREAKELVQISFQSHSNKKRLLPVEVNPCWK